MAPGGPSAVTPGGPRWPPGGPSAVTPGGPQVAPGGPQVAPGGHPVAPGGGLGERVSASLHLRAQRPPVEQRTVLSVWVKSRRGLRQLKLCE